MSDAKFWMVVSPVILTQGVQCLFFPDGAQFYNGLSPLCLVGFAASALLLVVTQGRAIRRSAREELTVTRARIALRFQIRDDKW